MAASLRIVPLTPDEQNAVTEYMKWVDQAPLKAELDSQVDLTGLDDVLQIFARRIKPWEKVKSI